jgi:NAD(P)-dependent dehydrogenase (short-subunit alcohol dehydrogenase family)
MASRALLPLKGRHCIITGAYGGIGAAIAKRFAAEGALLSLIGRKPPALQSLCEELPPYKHPRILHFDNPDDINLIVNESKSAADDADLLTHGWYEADVRDPTRVQGVLKEIWVCGSGRFLLLAQTWAEIGCAQFIYLTVVLPDVY